MLPGKIVVNDVWYKKWYSREVVHATFEAPVRRSKY